MKIYENFKNKIAIIYYKIFPALHGRGYSKYKDHIIKNLLKKKKTNYNTLLDERVIEIPWIIKELKKKSGKLLDAGSTLNQEYIIKELNHFKKKFISTLYPEKSYYNYLNTSYTYEDFEEISFKDSYFDVVTCISTLEHIGFDNSIYNYGKFEIEKKKKDKLKKVLKNLTRILKKKGTLLITIPFGKKGFFSNMQQFDKIGLLNILNIIKPDKYFIEYYKINNNKWVKCRDIECENVQPNIRKIKKKTQVLCANSIALIKIIK